MIRLSGVSKIFQTQKIRVEAVRDATARIPRGAVVLLSGHNGSGKSTLLSLMSGLLSPTSGRVYLDGKDISGMPERFISRIRREQIGMIFQERFLLPGLTAFENVVLPLVPMDFSNMEIRMKGKAILDQFGLSGKEKIPVNRLSGGEKQRLAIARALVNKPDIIFADEPTTHLDQDVLDLLTSEVTSWRKDKKTVVIATHRPDVLKNIKADKVFHLQNGRLTETVG